MILLGAGLAIVVERGTTDTRSVATADAGDEDVVVPTSIAPTLDEIASSDVTGTWAMRLIVVESTGFFGTKLGKSIEKTYTITSDCSATPCVLELTVSGQTGEYQLRRDGEEYVLSASGPNDCIDIDTSDVHVANGGRATVLGQFRPTAAVLTPRGDWSATVLTGSILTTFDPTNPACDLGSGVQRSALVGTRR